MCFSQAAVSLILNYMCLKWADGGIALFLVTLKNDKLPKKKLTQPAVTTSLCVYIKPTTSIIIKFYKPSLGGNLEHSSTKLIKMANNFCSIPVIDLQDFPAQTSKLVQVCQEWGCFRLINHQNILSNSLMSEMKSVVKSLFDLPPETKRRNTDVISGSGYVAPSQTNPLYEAFGLFISSQQHVDAFCSQLNASPYQR